MKLRQAQLEAFSEPQLQDFEDFMVGHLNKWFPDACQALGDDGTRRRIRMGVERAERYDILGRRDVCKYIDVMFTLGPGFDEDPELPWARQILAPRGEAPSEKVDHLVQAALRHRREHQPPEVA